MKKTICMALIMLSGVIVSAAQPKLTQKELVYLPTTAQIALFKAGINTPTDVLETQIAQVQKYNGVYNTELRDLEKELNTFSGGGRFPFPVRFFNAGNRNYPRNAPYCN